MQRLRGYSVFLLKCINSDVRPEFAAANENGGCLPLVKHFIHVASNTYLKFSASKVGLSIIFSWMVSEPKRNTLIVFGNMYFCIYRDSWSEKIDKWTGERWED